MQSGLRTLRLRPILSVTNPPAYLRIRSALKQPSCFISSQAAFVEGSEEMAAKEKAAKVSVQQLKTPKGTRDWVGADMLLRDHILYVSVLLPDIVADSRSVTVSQTSSNATVVYHSILLSLS